MLLAPESEVSERLAVKDLEDFTRAAVRVVQELVVELTIQPGGTVGQGFDPTRDCRGPFSIPFVSS